MNGNLRLLPEAPALSRRELANRSRMNESTIYRAGHGLTDLHSSTIRELTRDLAVSPTNITSSNIENDDSDRRREQ